MSPSYEIIILENMSPTHGIDTLFGNQLLRKKFEICNTLLSIIFRSISLMKIGFM